MIPDSGVLKEKTTYPFSSDKLSEMPEWLKNSLEELSKQTIAGEKRSIGIKLFKDQDAFDSYCQPFLDVN